MKAALHPRTHPLCPGGTRPPAAHRTESGVGVLIRSWLAAALLSGACGPAESGATAPSGTPSVPATTAAAALPESRATRASPATVLLVSIDTLRPDRLGTWGGQPEVAPRLDALARQAVVFDDALAPAPWTLPSHMTLLTGLDPLAHGVRTPTDRLSPEVETLAEVLSAQGFATAGFVDGGYVHGSYGFRQGFDTYDDDRSRRSVHGMRHLAPRAVQWLEQQHGRDVFLFVHTFDPHSPYDSAPPEILQRFRSRPAPDGEDDHALHFLSRFEQQRRVLGDYRRMSELLNDYDAGIHVADEGLGLLLDALSRSGRADDALIVVTSDHGESFFDCELHVGHGLLPSDAELRIPLVVRFPDGAGAGTRHAELTGLVDLAPTVLEALGFPVPPQWQGESLRGLVEGRPRATRSLVGSSSTLGRFFLATSEWLFITPMAKHPLAVARAHLGPESDEGVAYDFGAGDGAVTLRYDAGNDPFGLRERLQPGVQLFDRRVPDRQRRNLWLEQVRVGEELLAWLGRRLHASAALAAQRSAAALDGATPHEDAEQAAVLAALGYVGGELGDSPSPTDLPQLMRREAGAPQAPVERARLLTADRAVHRVRVLLAEGGTAGAAERAELQRAGRLYAEWLADHPKLLPRVSFRFRDCLAVAAAAGLRLDTAEWEDLVLEATGN